MRIRSAPAPVALMIAIALNATAPRGQPAPGDAGGADGRHSAMCALQVDRNDLPIADHDDDAALLASHWLIIPIPGISRATLRDTFSERRGASRHEAIDIFAPRGTPVVAAGDGRVVKLFSSVPGGHTVYQFDPDQKFAYYYAHLDAYAEGLKEGMPVKRGDTLGYVGTTGNAAADAPHLHFAIFRLGPERRWWQGVPVNPYAFLNDVRVE